MNEEATDIVLAFVEHCQPRVLYTPASRYVSIERFTDHDPGMDAYTVYNPCPSSSETVILFPLVLEIPPVNPLSSLDHYAITPFSCLCTLRAGGARILTAQQACRLPSSRPRLHYYPLAVQRYHSIQRTWQ